MVLTTLIPVDLPPQPPSPTPSVLYPSSGPGRGAYLIGGFIGLGILMLAGAPQIAAEARGRLVVRPLSVTAARNLGRSHRQNL